MAQTRRLAAIMFTDIAGYTAMMQRDEALALATVKRHREVLEQFTPAFHGEILEYYGDGSLIIFPSATEAVRCALAMQQTYREEPAVPLRIGIHVGEMIAEGGKVFGDGINLASRIQSLGQPGAVFFSGRVREDIRNHPDLRVASLGAFEFKNVDEPMEVFALAAEGLVVPDPATLEGKLKTPHLPAKSFSTYRWKRWLGISMALLAVFAASWFLNDLFFQNGSPLFFHKRASPAAIAILPFRNESPDPENTQYYCNGVMVAILNKLAGIEGLLVIPRQSVEQFRGSELPVPRIAELLDVEYLVEGSLRRQGKDVRLHASLLDARRNTTIWSGEYPGKLEDVFQMEIAVASSIVGKIEVFITPQEKARLEKATAGNYQAYDYFLQGMQYLEEYFNFRREAEAQFAVELARKALEEDADFGESYVLLSAIAYLKDHNLDSVLVLAQAALDRDPNLATAYSMMGRAYRDRGEQEKAKENFDQALRLNPNNYDALLASSILYRGSGAYEEALARVSKARRLNRLETLQKGMQFTSSLLPAEVVLGWLYRDIGAYEQAQEQFRTVLDLQPDNMEALEGTAFLEILKGQYAKAQEVTSVMLNVEPNYPAALALQADVLLLTGNYPEAVVLYEQLIANYNPQVLGLPGFIINIKNSYAYALGKTEKREQAGEAFREFIDEVKNLGISMDENSNQYYVVAYWLAQCHAQLGNNEMAFQYLRQIAQNDGFRNGMHDYLVIDPLFENLQNAPEFLAIVHEVQAEKTKTRERLLPWEEGQKN